MLQNINITNIKKTIGGLSVIKSQIELSNDVTLKAEQGKLVVKNSDNNTFVQLTTEAQTNGSFEAAVNKELFKNIISNFTSLEIKVEGNQVIFEEVINGTVTTSIKANMADESNIIKDFDLSKFTKSIAITGIKSAIEKVAFASATQDANRPALKGILLKSIGGKTQLIGTDSHRLSIVTFPQTAINTNIEGGDFELLLSPEIVSLLKKQEDISIRVNDTQDKLLIEMENELYILPLLDLTYPDVSKLIPTNYEKVSQVSVAEWLRACEKASFIANKNTNHAVDLAFTGSTITVETQNDLGEIKVDLPIQSTDNAVNVTVNNTFLKQALSSFKSDNVELKQFKQMLVFVEDGYTHLVLGLRK